MVTGRRRAGRRPPRRRSRRRSGGLRTELEVGRSLVVEANFRRLPPLPPCRPLQVFCTDEPHVLLERHRTRRRHPGHVDDARDPDPPDYAPLELDGPLLRYRIGDDAAALIEDVRRWV